ncbi:oligosaccharide 4-alpha-D-glucosyltransferase [Salinimicrobium catena]|uniref:Oligosaccharide 4-alpha-D-glucosyltransferase n=1 Tax=Salinimicrobium catena TaxID=390640 RepID=A0A1H5LEW7_9FLAO|nr:TIM-barrel domain-containing protein [Salinimicrobium catena]SDL08838.1 oligosaccharide 4-alpha-D-glucosyltransferase [Salinimicrobium catena]SEE75087.1 oligosaccharide 4-alpha-D-glucosyltransferase [Salinimicrobium catena]
MNFYTGLIKYSFCLAFLFSITLYGQNPEREFLEVRQVENSVEVKTGDGKYIFTPYTPEIIETSFLPSGEEISTGSHAVVLQPQQVPFELTEDSLSVLIDSEGIDVVIQKSPFQVSYFFKGEKIISEKTGYSRTEDHEKLDFNLTEPEMLFGGGARALGMNRRGHRLKLYNQAHYGYGSKSELLNYTLPVVLSSKKYALHFDNAPIGYLDLDSGRDNTLAYETINGRKVYQLVAGDSWEAVVGNYTLLTGRQPLPPRWTLGNFSSRFGYHSQKEVEQTIEKFKNEKIPVDAVILDLFWFGHDIKGTMGNLAFVRDSFPQPEKMISELAEKGVKTILVTEPFVLTTSNRWEEAVSENVLATDTLGNPFTYDFYFGNTGLIDIFDHTARKWFWDIYEGLAEMGVAGWWGDLGEPEVHPEELQHHGGTADEVHNIYGHYWAKMLYEGYQENYPLKRPFILMRAGAAGSQRYGLIPWSGDVSRSWGGLKAQSEISLQMGLQGLAYMHSDLGGFAGDHYDDELYVRWLQYGVFQPVFRPHAQEAVPSEPVFRTPEVMELAKKAIELRYRLLPYNYTLSFKNSVEGLPLMRPLFFEEPDNYRLYAVSNTYLWGDAFLVSPVVRPNISEKEIYFPGKSNWFDFYSGEKYPGGESATVQLKKEHIPTFIRGGAFVPMSEIVQTTEDFSAEKIEIHYFFDEEVKESSGSLFQDDGITANTIEKGNFELLLFRSKREGEKWLIEMERQPGKAKKDPEIQETELIIHNLNFLPKKIEVNGSKVKPEFNEKKQLTVPVRVKGDKTTIIIN